MTLQEIQQKKRGLSKSLFFGAVLLAWILWHWLPSPFSHHGDKRPTAPLLTVNKPSPAVPPAPSTAPVATPSPATPAVVPAAAPLPTPSDPLAPYAKMLGKWEGDQTITAHRGCRLDIEVREIKDKDKPFEAYSTLSCLPYPVELWRGAFTRKTSAILQGTGDAGENPVIKFQVMNNIGVAFSLDRCAMESLSLQSFGDGRVAAKWRETGGTANCIGGEVVMTPRRNY